MKKISELTTEEAVDYLCEMTPYVANISADEELLKVLREKIEGVSPKWELTTVWGVGYRFRK